MIHDAIDDSRPVVLVVDDSPMIHRLLELKLKDQDVDLLAAGDGRQGIELACSRTPALILLDLDMPVLDGFEVLRQLKSDTQTMHIPVIIISSSERTEDKVLSFELGAMDVVQKPFEATELRARIRSAIRISTLMALLEQRAQIDGLTGLGNRKLFDTRLEEKINESGRRGDPMVLALADLDHFKSINDTYGHQAGDEALVTFAKMLNKNLRGYDVACRYGGEEFAIILPNVTELDALHILERIRIGLEEHRWDQYPGMRVTVSFGITSAGKTGDTPGQWVVAADVALYSAKQAGRNRVHRYDPGSNTCGILAAA